MTQHKIYKNLRLFKLGAEFILALSRTMLRRWHTKIHYATQLMRDIDV